MSITTGQKPACGSMFDHGNSGDGLKAYAARIGVRRKSLSEWVGAATVYKSAERSALLEQLQDVSVRALYEISKAPKPMNDGMRPQEKRNLADDYDRRLQDMEAHESEDLAFGPEIMEHLRRIFGATTKRLRLEAHAESHKN